MTTAVTAQECKKTKERVRAAMGLGFSLNFMVKQCGLSHYRVSSAINDIADGRIAGGDLNAIEIHNLNKYLEKSARKLDELNADRLYDALNLAIKVGIKGSSIAYGAGVTVNRFNQYLSRVSAGKDDWIMFSEEERRRFFDYLQSIVEKL